MISKEQVSHSKILQTLQILSGSKIFWITAFAILTALSAQVAIPAKPVPFTLQTMLVLLSGAFLGSRNGAYSQILYLVIGVIGVPVFAGFTFGVAKLFGPTGGYLLTFPFAAFLVGYILEKKNNSFLIILSFIAGQLLIFLAGAIYLSVFIGGDFSKAFFSGAIIFSIWDIIKTVAAFSIYKAVSKKYP